MAHEVMGFSRKTVDSGVEILFNSEYVGMAVTLDTTAFTNGVCEAGTPIAKDGKKGVTTPGANGAAGTTTAFGILLADVHQDRPQATIVIGGYINTAVASAHSGVTYDAETKTALKNVVFM